jgi:hypothetical protein
MFERPSFEQLNEPEQGALAEEKLEITEPPESPEAPGSKEELQAEIKAEAKQFDRELSGIVQGRTEAGELDKEKADEILSQAEKLKPQDKAEIRKELAEEKNLSPQELEEKAKVESEHQESIAQYEAAIDNLVSRANNLGIEISSSELRAQLEKFKNIEPQPEEEMDWQEYLDAQLQRLNEKISGLEKEREAGTLTPEKREAAKKDLTKTIEELAAKTAEFVAKLALRIVKGLIKGVFRAFRATAKG